MTEQAVSTADPSTPSTPDHLVPTLQMKPGQQWFVHAGLGMFVHWDHASQQGIEISWPLVGMSYLGAPSPGVEGYQSTAATFDPQQWDAKEVAALAKRSGASYVVFTSKHHAGFAMYPTQQSDWSIEKASPFGRDVVREYVDAVRAEGLRVGIYFSLCDWSHPDYPAFTDEMLPYQHKNYPRPSAEQWQRYQDFLRAQLAEVLTWYGTVDLLWFDGEWERTAQEWDSAGLEQHIRSFQPDVVINDRLPDHGDYITPEQGFPTRPIDGPWELCLTIGDQWSYSPNDTRTKSPRSLLITLMDVASRGGNLLLNLGPRPDGSLDPVHVEVFTEIGRWMDTHAESVRGVSPTRGVEFFGPTTGTDDAIYLHLAMRPIDEVVARNIPVERVDKVTLLADGRELAFHTSVNVHEEAAPGHDRLGTLTIEAPEPSDALVDVIKISLS